MHRRAKVSRKPLFCKTLFLLAAWAGPICEEPSTIIWSSHFGPYYAGGAQRYSTLGGVSWSPDQNYIATVHFEAGALCLYRFEQEKCTLVQTVWGKKGAPLLSAENLSFSPDGALLAVSMNHSHSINIYQIDPHSHRIIEKPALVVVAEDPCVHGVRFANTANFLAYTNVRGDYAIGCYNVRRGERMSASLISKLPNAFLPLKAKSIDFTKDDRFVVAVYSNNIIKNPNGGEALIVVYAFNAETGVLNPSPISIKCHSKSGILEDVRFCKDDSSFFVSDQMSHEISIYAFDRESGVIGERVGVVGNPQANLKFPHGIGLSPDGKYLAAANYGHDNFSIYRLFKSSDKENSE